MSNYLHPTTPENVVQNYLLASYQANEEKIRDCFFKEAMIIGEISNELIQWKINDLIQRIMLADDKEKSTVFNKEILQVEKTSQLAIIKARNAVRNWVFIDTLVLKLEKSIWKIATKYFMMADQMIK